MITEEDVYVCYRKAKSLQTGKGFRIPKDWDSHFNTKMKDQTRNLLIKAAGYFNTTWSNVDIQTYMEVGCRLYATFSYHMFFKPQVLSEYISQDKRQKRLIKANIEKIDESFDHINEWLIYKGFHSSDYTNLQLYCKCKDGEVKTIVADYLKNLIDPVLLSYCIFFKYIKLTDIEREYCYNVVNRYRDVLEQMFRVEDEIKRRDVQ